MRQMMQDNCLVRRLVDELFQRHHHLKLFPYIDWLPVRLWEEPQQFVPIKRARLRKTE